MASKYDLVANILHDGKAGEGTYRAHIHRKSEEAWCARAAGAPAVPACCSPAMRRSSWGRVCCVLYRLVQRVRCIPVVGIVAWDVVGCSRIW